VNDIVTLLPCGQQLRNNVRRMLEIGIHRYDNVALGMVEPSRQRRLVPKIPGEKNVSYPVIRSVKRIQDGRRVVTASIIDEQDRPWKANFLQLCAEDTVRLRQHLCLIERRKHNAKPAAGLLPSLQRERQR
jgi:hypothetical protein